MERIEVSNLDYVRNEPRGSGIAEKFWVNDGTLKLVKLSSTDQDLMELLSYRILSTVGLPCVSVELCYDSLSKKKGCLIGSFLTDEADVSYETVEWQYVNSSDQNLELRKSFNQVFERYSNLYGISLYELERLKRDYVRIIFGKCLIENFDSKLDNIGLIFNEKKKTYRLPPSFDNGCAFRSFESLVDPIIQVGNQIFNLDLVTRYIVENYMPYVEDIISALELLTEEKIASVLSDLDIDIKKKRYIMSYLLNFKTDVIDMKNKRRHL